MQNTVYDQRSQSLSCLHCFEVIELRRKTWNDAEALMQVREEYEMDHGKCHEYKDIRKAQQARRFRTERQRREMHDARQRALRALGCAPPC